MKMILSLGIPVLLQLAGILVVMAEILIPSGGLLGILAIGLIGYSLYMTFTQFQPMIGFIFVMVDLVSLPFIISYGFKLLAKSDMSLHQCLSGKDGYVSYSDDYQKLVGLQGKVLKTLRPSGLVLIDGQKYDVVSRGEFIDKDTDIVVDSVQGNIIIVKRTNNQVG